MQPISPKSYQLTIHLAQAIEICVGAIGTHRFEAGYYIYTGSAKRNIEARIARHCRKEKPLRWHIDYLTCHPQSRVVKTVTSSGDECALNQETGGVVTMPGFGASDCKSGCGAHLKYIGLKF